MQETNVVFKHQTKIVDTESCHGDSFNTHTEREAGIYVGVDATVRKNEGMYHTRAENFHPAFALAKTASLSAANEAGNVNLRGGFCEREVVGTEADLGFGTEHLLCEELENTLEVTHGDALINNKTFYLMEDRRMCCVRRVGTVYTAGRDDANRGLGLFHNACLNGRRLGTEKNIVCDIEDNSIGIYFLAYSAY